MTASITIFPAVKSSPGERRDESAIVIILPVVRVDLHPGAPGWQPRRSRRRVLEKVRQLQEEMLRSPRS